MTLEQIAGTATQANSIREAIEIACKRIAPTWPLDQFIAVNPYWGFVGDPIQDAAARLESYSGSHMVMPRSFYRDQWQAGSLRAEHLHEALQRSGLSMSMAELIEKLEGESPSAPRVPLVTAAADSQRDLLHGMSISDFVTHNVSQHCASYFDHCQSSWETQHKESLYESWLHHARSDMSPWLLMGIHNMRHYARSLPNDPVAVIEEALHVLPVSADEWANYLTTLLMSINGWASWCAYERWQAQLSQTDDDHIVQLLAIRIAWEQFAFRHLLEGDMPTSWNEEWARLREAREFAGSRPSVDWVYQEAMEISYQSKVCEALKSGSGKAYPNTASILTVQAVFCIDVRSEVFRRALEACSESIQTLGFAGFFGLPISYTPLGSTVERPQLPGLLAPKLWVSESSDSEEVDRQTKNKREQVLGLKSIWKDFRSSATSTFTFVESCGLFYASSLLKSTLHRPNRKVAVADANPGKQTSLRP